MGNEVIHVFNETENHVEIVQYDRNKIFQRKFNNDPSTDPVTKIEKCSDRYPYIEIRMRHEGSSMVHEVGFYSYSDHSWIVGEGGVRRQKEGEGLNVVDPDNRDGNYYRERGDENYMWKYCKQIKRYNWLIKPFLDQTSDVIESGRRENEAPFYYSDDYEADHSGKLSLCTGEEKKVFDALIDEIKCEDLGREKDMIITAEKLKKKYKIQNPKSFRLDFQHPDRDKIINKQTKSLSIQYGSLTYATVHLKYEDAGIEDNEFLEQVKAGFSLSQEKFETASQGIWVVKESDLKPDKKPDNKPVVWLSLTREDLVKELKLQQSNQESSAKKTNPRRK